MVEASVSSQVPECLTLSRRLAARQADAEARSSTATNKVGMPRPGPTCCSRRGDQHPPRPNLLGC